MGLCLYIFHDELNIGQICLLFRFKKNLLQRNDIAKENYDINFA